MTHWNCCLAGELQCGYRLRHDDSAAGVTKLRGGSVRGSINIGNLDIETRNESMKGDGIEEVECLDDDASSRGRIQFELLESTF